MKPKNNDAPPSEAHTTAEAVFRQRRSLVKGLMLTAAVSPALAYGGWFSSKKKKTLEVPETLATQYGLKYEKDAAELTQTTELRALTHNNFYEFGTEKTDPFQYAQQLKTEPWTLAVSGEVEKPGTVDVWSLNRDSVLQERIYRMRCVEGWSMVIPWVGVPLAQILQRHAPTSRAKYVVFESLYDPEQMRGQRSFSVGGRIDYPYVEGLRMDEAMHPLTLLALGAYGKTLAPQNGAPVRLVVPWKYGFKGIKSIVNIRLVESRPRNSWNILAPREYGFYANVNPEVDHPRWSQASERFLGDGGLGGVKRQKTLMFNGYEEQVGQMYSGMNLKRWY